MIHIAPTLAQKAAYWRSVRETLAALAGIKNRKAAPPEMRENFDRLRPHLPSDNAAWRASAMAVIDEYHTGLAKATATAPKAASKVPVKPAARVPNRFREMPDHAVIMAHGHRCSTSKDRAEAHAELLRRGFKIGPKGISRSGKN